MTDEKLDSPEARAKATPKKGPTHEPRAAVAEESPPPRWVLPAIMISVLIVGGWFIIQNLADNSKMEDCVMAGRKNCVPPIDTSNMH